LIPGSSSSPMRAFVIILLLALTGACSSTRLVSEWKNPDIQLFRAEKVLVLGITPDTTSRRMFEERLIKSLLAKDVEAVSSMATAAGMDLDDDFGLAELKELEKSWAAQGFDAVLVSKITGQESRKSVVQSARGFMDEFQTFSDYYDSSREVYGRPPGDSYRVFNAESSVFCICPGQTRNLVWRGRIDIVDPNRGDSSIRDYVRTLIQAMAEQNILTSI